MSGTKILVLGADMNKILRAFVLPFALFFTLSTATAPARAVLPLIASGVAFIAEGSTAANALAALTVGTVAGMIYLGNLQTGTGATDGSGSYMEIPLGTSRSRSLSTPPGYTPPANNDAQPAPPGTSAPVPAWQTGVSAGYYSLVGSADAACSGYYTWSGATTNWYPPGPVTMDGANAICTFVAKPGYTNQVATFTPLMACGAGYTVSGSSCVLSNPALVMKPADGRCHILMNVNGFVIDPQDPECGGLAANTGTTVTPTKITQTKPGTLTNGTVTINPDGSRTIVYSTSNTTNNTTTNTTVNMIPAASGGNATITGTSTVVVNGTGTAAGTTPAALPPIQFPDDYNREITQGQIKTGIEALHGDLDSSAFAQPAAPPVPSDLAAAENKKITDELNLSVTSYDNFKLLDWSTWIPVFPASACTPIAGNIKGVNVSFDPCPKIAMLNELIGWMLAVYASWSVVMMAFRRD